MRALICLLPCLPLIGYSAPVHNGAVEAELVSAVASIQPGQSFMVALRMQHDAHWHTYWKNAGTGFPTSLDWKLPPGFSAGPIEWPTPEIFTDPSGKVTGHGYEGENFLLIKITPPPDLPLNTEVTLKARADWLMCQEVCMPGGGDVSLLLPVRATPPAADEKWSVKIAAAAERLPIALPPGWSATATKNGNMVELRLKLVGGTRPSAASLRFLSDDGFIDYEADQSIKMDKDGYRIRLKVAESADPAAKRLTGILRAEQGWTGGANNEWKPGTTPVGVIVHTGLQVDVPFAP